MQLTTEECGAIFTSGRHPAKQNVCFNKAPCAIKGHNAECNHAPEGYVFRLRDTGARHGLDGAWEHQMSAKEYLAEQDRVREETKKEVAAATSDWKEVEGKSRARKSSKKTRKEKAYAGPKPPAIYDEDEFPPPNSPLPKGQAGQGGL